MKQAILVVLALLICAVPVMAQNETNATNSTNESDTLNTADATGTFMVVKHLCDAEIRSTADFSQLGDAISQEIACPTIILPQDDFMESTIHGEQAAFDILVQGETGAFQTLDDATFVQARLCEPELERDLDEDDTREEDVCLDMSGYRFDNVDLGNVTMTETQMPADMRFGTVAVGAGISIISSTENGVIQFDTTDEDADSYTVHIFNFRNIDSDTDGTTNETTSETATISDTAGGANLFVKEWYPKENHFVFVCDVSGFTPTSYSWFYGDGHKLLNIHNGDTYHIYDAPGTYEVMCTATDGVNTASDTLSVTATDTRSASGFVCMPDSSIACDGNLLDVDACQTVSCGSLCIGSLCMSNVQNIEVCPENRQITGTTGIVNDTERANLSDTTCINELENVPATCLGGEITMDTDQRTPDNCRHTTCTDGSNSLTVLSCEQPDELNPEYYEVYKESQTGSGLELCIGDACISENGYARSENFSACTQASTIGLNQEMLGADATVTVCHNGETTLIDESTLTTHLQHGDTLSACAETNTTTNTTGNMTNTT